MFGVVDKAESSLASLGGVGKASIADPAAPVNPAEFCDKNEDSGDEENSEGNG
jgi:hypothetical protein